MSKMNKNLSNLDRVLRFILGLSFIYIGYFLLIGLITFIFVFLGIALIINSITGFCGIYYILGISTCRLPKKSKK